MQIKVIENKRDLDKFIRLPWQIYKNDPNWVPPLISEVKSILDPQKNPFWEHARQILFLAIKEGKVVGRVAGIIDRNHIAFHKEKVGFFGFFEAFDDYEIAELLLSEVREWLRVNGMKAMRGPLNPCQNEECGLLVKGFHSPPMLLMTYNPPYYERLLERFGLRKAKDLYAYYAPVFPEPPEILETTAEYARKRHPEAKIRPVDLKRVEEEKKKIKKIYNAAWEKNWGFVPMTEKEFSALVERLKPLVVPELALFVEIRGEPVGFILGIPDYNQALRKMNGRLFPFGWLKLIYYSRRIRTLRLVIMGVLKDYRLSGLEALLYRQGNRNAYELGYQGVEFSWVLEDNILTRRAAENYGGKVYKTYRIFELRI